MKNLLNILIGLIVGIGLSFGTFVFADNATYDFINYNVPYNLGYFNNRIGGWLFGGTATTSDALLEVQGDVYIAGNATTTKSMDALEFCIDGQDCIDSWSAPGVGINNWQFNASGQLTPSTTIDVSLPANATTTDAHYIGDHLSVGTQESFHTLSVGGVSMILNSEYNNSDVSIWFGNTVSPNEDRFWLDNYDTTYFGDLGETFVVSDDLAVEGSVTTTGNLYVAGNATTTGSHYIGGDLAIDGNFPMNQVDGKIIGSPTLTNLEDYYNLQSAGFVTINGIDDDGDGTITVKAGYGIIKTEDSDSGENRFFDWATSTTVSLTDEATNWIYIDYNGGSPIPNATTDITSLDLHTEIVVGRVWKDGTTIQVLSGLGQDVDDYMTEACYKDFEVYGFQAVPGTYVLTEDGTRYLDITEGIGYCAHNRYTCSAKNTNTGGDTFTYVYRDGGTGFTFDDNGGAGYTQVSNILYDDGDGTPGNVNNNRYATYYVYETFADEFGTCQLYVQMGQNRTNNLSQAQMESVPTPPGLLRDFSNLVARIIIEKGDTNFTEIELNTPTTNFQASVVGNHNDLGNLPWGLSGHTGTVNTFAGFDGTGAATYYTEASYGQLAQNETITGSWTFNWLSATSSFQYWWNNTTTWAGFQNEFNKYYNASTTLVTSDYVWDFSDNTNATAGSNIQFNDDEIAVVDSPEFVNASTTGSLYVGGDLTVAGDTSVVNVTVVNTTSTGSIYVTNDLGLNSVYINSWSDITDTYGWATTSEQYFWNNTSTWTAYDTNWNRNYNATTTLNGFTPADYLLNSAYYSTTTWAGGNNDLVVTGNATVTDSLFISDIKLEADAALSALAVQGQTSGLPTYFAVGTKDDDGTDYSGLVVSGKNTFTDIANRETLLMLWNPSGTYEINTYAAGTGVVRDLDIFTGSDKGQIYLEAGGDVRIPYLHATTTDFDALQVNGNAQVTGFLNVTGNIITDSNLFADDIYVGPGYSYKYGTVPSNVTIAFADIALDNFFFASAGNRTMTGNYNNGLGRFALKENTTGIQNVAIGRTALEENTTGSDNTAIGTGSLNDNTEGYFNSAIGSGSLSANTTGHDNFALGYSSLFNNQTGNYNVAIGNYSLTSNVLGDNNIAIGYLAGQNALGSDNIFIGSYAGSNEVGTSTFYLGNKEQSNVADDRAKSMMFGILDDDPLNQQLTFNTHFEVNGTTTLATTTFSFDGGNNIGSVSQVIFPSGGVPDIALGGKGIYMDVFGLKDYGYIYNTTENESPLLGFGSFDTDNAAVMSFNTTSNSLFFTLATPNEAGDEVETEPLTGFTVFSENFDFSASSSDLIINYSVVGNNVVAASLTFSSTTDQLSWTGASGYNFDNDVNISGNATVTTQFNLGNDSDYARFYLAPGFNVPIFEGYSSAADLHGIASLNNFTIVEDTKLITDNPNFLFLNSTASDNAGIIYGTTTDQLAFLGASGGYSFDNDISIVGNVTTTGHVSVGVDDGNFNFGNSDLNIGDNLYVGLDLMVNQNATTTGSLWVSNISTLATTTMAINSKIQDTDASYYFSVEGYDLNDPGDLGASITNIPTIVFHNSSELLGNNAGIMNGELIIIEDIYSAGNEEDDMPKLTFASNDISNILNGSASSIEYNTTTDVLNFTDASGGYSFDNTITVNDMNFGNATPTSPVAGTCFWQNLWKCYDGSQWQYYSFTN